jgi:peptidoglycan hydrolase-like protein with peptidoglycan-binding domain
VRSNTVRIRDHQPSVVAEFLLGIGRLLSRSAASAILRRRPIDTLAILGATAAVAVIVVNAVFLQTGSHPAPFFAAPVRPPAVATVSPRIVPLPPRPVSAEAARPDTAGPPRASADVISDIQRELFSRGLYDGAIDGIYGPRTDAAIRDFEQRTGRRPGAIPSESLLRAIVQSPLKAVRQPAADPVVSTGTTRSDPIARLIAPSTRVTAVQRALADFGYGQIKPTGTVDRDTQAAIEKFERERKLPVTGQISDRFLRELGTVTGRPLD